MTLSIMYSLTILTIDVVTSFLQLMDVQNIRKNMCFSPNKSYKKYHTVQDGKIVIDSEGFVHVLNRFVSMCVRIEINSHW